MFTTTAHPTTQENAMTDYATDFPAAEGRTVTEGHARYCREHKHATWTVDGEEIPQCPRCRMTWNEIQDTIWEAQHTEPEFSDEDDITDITGESAVDWWVDAPELNAMYEAGALTAQPISGDYTTLELNGAL